MNTVHNMIKVSEYDKEVGKIIHLSFFKNGLWVGQAKINAIPFAPVLESFEVKPTRFGEGIGVKFYESIRQQISFLCLKDEDTSESLISFVDNVKSRKLNEFDDPQWRNNYHESITSESEKGNVDVLLEVMRVETIDAMTKLYAATDAM